MREFDLIMKRVWEIVLDDRYEMQHRVEHSEKIEFFNMEGSLVETSGLFHRRNPKCRSC